MRRSKRRGKEDIVPEWERCEWGKARARKSIFKWARKEGTAEEIYGENKARGEEESKK